MGADVVPDLVVVGVDGSENSIAALRWAIEEATARHLRLEVLHAWLVFPSMPGTVAAESVGAFPPLEDEELGAKELLATTMAKAWSGQPPVEVVLKTVRGQAPEVLVAASETAALVVVGARGHTGLAEFLVGSTTIHVVRHSHCPVVVVPARH